MNKNRIDVYSNDIHETIRVKIDNIEVDGEYINVFHDSEIALYDCVEFEEAISALCQFEVKFTEYMSQDSYFSRLEAV